MVPPLEDSAEFIDSIAPDVMESLEKKSFFSRLEEMVFTDHGEHCNHDFVNATALLNELGYSKEDMADIFAVFKSRGGYCDCEIIYNVLEESLPKERYWKARAEELKEQKVKLVNKK